MVRGLASTPSSPNDQGVCVPCLEGKQHKSPFPNQPSRAKGLQLSSFLLGHRLPRVSSSNFIWGGGGGGEAHGSRGRKATVRGG